MSCWPWPQQPICLPLHSAWVSQSSAPQTTFLPGKRWGRGGGYGRGGGGGARVNGEGYLQRSFDASPCFLLLEGLLIFKHARLEPWCVFVWSGSHFMGCCCTLESLEYFNYKNYHALGPFGLTTLLSFLPKLGCVCLRRKCTLSEHSDCFNIHLDSPIKLGG